jgi:hypothetical protein
MTGVPAVTDVSRIIQKVRAVRLNKLPKEIAERVEQQESYILTGIALSGGRTLDELMLGRTLLYDKIYRHQKVRAAEAMVSVLLNCLSDISAIHPALVPFRFDDEMLLALPPTWLRFVAGRAGTRPRGQIEIAADISQKLSSRQLFVRAFAFAQNMPLDPYRTEELQRTGMERVLRECEDGPARATLVRLIAKEAKRVLKMLRWSKIRNSPTGKHFASYICISPPEPPSNGSDIMRAYLIADDKRTVRFKDDSAETRGWADAYLLTNDIGYIFTPREVSSVVYVAAEKVFRMQYKIRMPESMLSYAKQRRESIDEIKRSLISKGFYVDCALDLKPLPRRLQRGDVVGIAEEAVQRFSGYLGPIDIQKDKAKQFLSVQRVIDWCRQFEEDQLVDAALRVIRHIKLLDRLEITTALQGFLNSKPDFRNSSVSPFGTPKDSSAITTYYSGDIAPQFNLNITTVFDAIKKDAPILFVDDFIGSGKQAVSILEGLLDLPLTYKLGEKRIIKLGEVEKMRFREAKFALVFVAGLEEGRQRLEQFIQDQHLNGTVHIGTSESSLPSIEDVSMFRDGAQQTAFIRRCKELGLSLLHNPSVRHNSTWCSERLLGYGNRGLLTLFPYNTPTQSLTCMWAPASSKQPHWLPLFPRRKKT